MTLRLNERGDLEIWRFGGRGIIQTIPAAELRAALAEAGLAIVPVEPSEAMLEVGRQAVETALIERRDSRFSEPLRGNGLVIREKDGAESSVIRFGYRAMLQAAPKEAEHD